MACSPITLFDTAKCFQCVPPGQWQLLKLALLCRISTGDTSVCNVQSLLSEAACFACLAPGQLQLLELSLLCTIATSGGGGGGSGGLSNGAIDPVAAPTDATVTNIYVNTATNTVWVWPANAAAWTQIV